MEDKELHDYFERRRKLFCFCSWCGGSIQKKKRKKVEDNKEEIHYFHKDCLDKMNDFINSNKAGLGLKKKFYKCT